MSIDEDYFFFFFFFIFVEVYVDTGVSLSRPSTFSFTAAAQHTAAAGLYTTHYLAHNNVVCGRSSTSSATMYYYSVDELYTQKVYWMFLGYVF